MKHQVLFSSKDKSEKLKCRLLQFLFGALRVNSINTMIKYMFILPHNFDKKVSTKVYAMAYSAVPDETAHDEPPYLSLHCLLILLQSTLVISTSIISNIRLSRRENQFLL